MRSDALMFIVRDGNALHGESTEEESANLIEILSFALEIDTVEHAPDYWEDVPRTVIEHLPVRVVRPVDNVSPKLHDCLNKGYRDLDVSIVVLKRTGVSTGGSDSWKRDELFGIELTKAQIVSVRVVADPSIQFLSQQSVYASESLRMGPLEEVEISYGEIEYYYGQRGNKMTWTHPRYRD